jgi:hypothetical protein
MYYAFKRLHAKFKLNRLAQTEVIKRKVFLKITFEAPCTANGCEFEKVFPGAPT